MRGDVSRASLRMSSFKIVYIALIHEIGKFFKFILSSGVKSFFNGGLRLRVAVLYGRQITKM